jgi:hypothetical protein
VDAVQLGDKGRDISSKFNFLEWTKMDILLVVNENISF